MKNKDTLFTIVYFLFSTILIGSIIWYCGFYRKAEQNKF